MSIHTEAIFFNVLTAEVPDVYPLGMMGFMIWDANSTDIGMPAKGAACLL